MPEVICNTSPLQYLHQLELLHVLPALTKRVTVPPAVVEELSQGRARGFSLPNPTDLEWVVVRSSGSGPALQLIHDLGPGESEVLVLTLEIPESMVILDDLLARQVAETRGIPLTGTLGLLLDAKRAGLVPEVRPLLDQLLALRFRLSIHTRAAVLRLAGEV